MVANSLTHSAKAEAAPRQYNMRVVECRLAAAVLGLKLGLTQVDQCLHIQPKCYTPCRSCCFHGAMRDSGALSALHRRLYDY